MVIGIPKETLHGENRVGINPAAVKDLAKKGFEILIEVNAGADSFINKAFTMIHLAKDANVSFFRVSIFFPTGRHIF